MEGILAMAEAVNTRQDQRQQKLAKANSVRCIAIAHRPRGPNMLRLYLPVCLSLSLTLWLSVSIFGVGPQALQPELSGC